MSLKLFRLFCPPRYAFLKKAFSGRPFTLLDVGCGHLSFEVVKHHFPRVRYHGVDKRIQGERGQYQSMDRFFDLDLDSTDFSAVEDDAYDAIVFSHTIEHLFNGHQVLQRLIPKLKVGGYLYVEFPSERSMFLPSAEGTLCFFDDPTHIRLYSVKEVANTLLANDVRVLKAGTARHFWRMIIVTPFGMLFNLYHYARHGRWSARGLLDISGFAAYLFGVRHRYPQGTRLGSWELTEAHFEKPVK